MVKDSGNMQLLASKGTQSPSREIAAEMECRAPLSPILVKSRNKVPAHPHHAHSNYVHPTSHLSKKVQMAPSSLSQRNHSGEYVENVTAFSPGTPEHKLSAPGTPKSASKKKFGWNVSRQPHEDSAHGSLLFSFSLVSQLVLSGSQCSSVFQARLS